MKIKCKTCGEKFTPTKEDIEIAELSGLGMPEECEECLALSEGPPDFETPSDADSGL